MQKLLLSSSIAVSVAAAHAQFISAYDFNDTLDPFINVGGHAQALEGRAGRSTNAAWSPTYSTENVNGNTKRVANFDDVASQEKFFRARHGMSPNGGAGAVYVNQYSILMDLKITSVGDWVSFFNTNATNSNDGDAFINTSNGVGISGDYSGNFSRNEWHRVILTMSTPNGGPHSMNIYVDGVHANQINLDGFEGRWAAYAWNDPGSITHVDILADNDGDSGAGQISMLAFADRVIGANEAGQLGGAGAAVPEPITLAVLGLGVLPLLRRRKVG